jgi:hypothetical protein
MRPLCAMQLWTVLGFASDVAHKYQSGERVVSCSFNKQPSSKSCVFAYETIQTSVGPSSEMR